MSAESLTSQVDSKSQVIVDWLKEAGIPEDASLRINENMKAFAEYGHSMDSLIASAFTLGVPECSRENPDPTVVQEERLHALVARSTAFHVDQQWIAPLHTALRSLVEDNKERFSFLTTVVGADGYLSDAILQQYSHELVSIIEDSTRSLRNQATSFKHVWYLITEFVVSYGFKSLQDAEMNETKTYIRGPPPIKRSTDTETSSGYLCGLNVKKGEKWSFSFVYHRGLVMDVIIGFGDKRFLWGERGIANQNWCLNYGLRYDGVICFNNETHKWRTDGAVAWSDKDRIRFEIDTREGIGVKFFQNDVPVSVQKITEKCCFPIRVGATCARRGAVSIVGCCRLA